MLAKRALDLTPRLSADAVLLRENLRNVKGHPGSSCSFLLVWFSSDLLRSHSASTSKKPEILASISRASSREYSLRVRPSQKVTVRSIGSGSFLLTSSCLPRLKADPWVENP